MSIADNIERLRERIEHAAVQAGRSAENITLIAVSKKKPISDIVSAYEAGLRHFGENRAGELAEKSAELAHLPDINWHKIGQLQTRQSLPVAQHAHAFHAIDRVKIARRLSSQLERPLPVFIEVNVSGELQKAGFNLSAWETDTAQRETFLRDVATIVALPRIEVIGLMTMAPWGESEGVIRPIFERTRALADHLTTTIPQASWHNLSMGMTDDFEIAIASGATHIRIGTAIFGKRNY